MSGLETILLGIVQGLTEFLPISSSGHLVMLQDILGFDQPELLLDCSLHFGTMVAVCFYFREDLKRMAVEIWQRDYGGASASLLWKVLVGTLPTALIALGFKDYFEGFYASVSLVGTMLLGTGIILVATGGILGFTRLLPEGYGKRTEVGVLVALAVGTAQGLAIIPGISRSGATIACGLFCGLERDLAGRFSFLLSIPAILGAVAMQINLEGISRIGAHSLFLGFFVSAVVGFLALKFLMGLVRKGHIHYFAPYCWVVGAIVIIVQIA